MDEELIFRASLQDNASQGLDQLRAKTQQVGQASKSSASGLDVLNKSMNRSAGAVTKFGSGSQSALGRFNRAAMASAKASESATGRISAGFKRAAVGIVGAFGAIQIAMAGWRRLTSIEDAEAKLRGLGNSATAVKAIMANALTAVKGTAFGLDEAATAAAGAVAAGIKPGKQLEAVLKAVANGAAAAGIGMGEMGAIFNKVASLGKAQNDVLQQVANRGLPIYERLAEQFGVTADQVFKMATKGQIGFEQFQKAMTAAAGTVADEMGKTTTGMIRNMGAALSRFGALMMSSVQPVAKTVFGTVTESVDGLGKAISALFTGIGSVAGPVMRFFTGLPSVVRTAVAALAALVAFRGPILRLFTMFGTPLRAAVSGLTGFGRAITGAGTATGVFGRQVRMLQAGGMGRLRSVFNATGYAAKGFGKSLLGAVGGIGGLAITGALAAVTWGLTKLGEAQQKAKQRAEEHAAAERRLADALGQTGRVSSQEWQDAALANLTEVNVGDNDLTKIVGLAGNRFNLVDVLDAQAGDSRAQNRIRAGVEAQKAALLAAAPQFVAPERLPRDTDASYSLRYGQAQLAANNAAAAVRQSSAFKDLDEMFGQVEQLFGANLPTMLDTLNQYAATHGMARTFTEKDLDDLVNAGKARDANQAFEQLAKSIGIGVDKADEFGDAATSALDAAANVGTAANRVLSQIERHNLAGWARSLDNPVVQTLAAIGDAAKSATERTDALRLAIDRALGRDIDARAVEAQFFAAQDALFGKDGLFGKGTTATRGKIESLFGVNGEILLNTAAGRDLSSGAEDWRTATIGQAQQRYMEAGGAAGGQAALDAAMKVYNKAAGKWLAGAAEHLVDKSTAQAGLDALFGKDGSAIVDAIQQVPLAQLQAAIGTAATAAGDDVQAQLEAAVQAAADWAKTNGLMTLPAELDTTTANVDLDLFRQKVQQTIRMNIVADFQSATGALTGSAGAAAADWARTTKQADGGILNRDAMIAAGGSNVLWAEPETHGEAYIPFNPAKRPRAEQILDTVAHQFGGTYLPPAAALARPMSDGGITRGGTATATLPAVNLSVNVDARGARDPQSVADRTAAEVEKIVVNLFRRDRERRM